MQILTHVRIVNIFCHFHVVGTISIPVLNRFFCTNVVVEMLLVLYDTASVFLVSFSFMFYEVSDEMMNDTMSPSTELNEGNFLYCKGNSWQQTTLIVESDARQMHALDMIQNHCYIFGHFVFLIL